MSGELAGHVIAVAGAGGPAGRAVVRRLAAAGAVVSAADADADRLDASVTDARAAVPGAVIEGRVVDLLDLDAASAWVAGTEEAHGRLDGLVHLVGGWRGGRGLTPEALEHWALLERLLVGTAQVTSLAAHDALLRSGRGRFAIVSAAGAGRPTAGNAAYAAAKAAAEAWTLAVGDSFAKAAPESGPDAAATIVVVKALYDDAMRAARPEAKFPGYTHVDDLAETIAGLWARPTAELNGARTWLTEQPS